MYPKSPLQRYAVGLDVQALVPALGGKLNNITLYTDPLDEGPGWIGSRLVL